MVAEACSEQASQKRLADRIRRGIAEGDMPADADALAAHFATVFQSMAVQARDCTSQAELARIGATAMHAWPAA